MSPGPRAFRAFRAVLSEGFRGPRWQAGSHVRETANATKGRDKENVESISVWIFCCCKRRHRHQFRIWVKIEAIMQFWIGV